MKVIAVVGQKGGSGKTMTSENIAALATKAGLKVLVVDLDPQTNVCLWSDRRGTNSPMVVSAQVGRLSHVLKVAAEEGADMAILDTPPKATEVSTAASRAGSSGTNGNRSSARRKPTSRAGGSRRKCTVRNIASACSARRLSSNVP